MAYVVNNPEQELVRQATATLGSAIVATPAPAGPLASFASALNTSESSLLLLLGGGALLGWVANDFVTGTKKTIRRRRSAAKRTRAQLADSGPSGERPGINPVKMLLAGGLAVGLVWFLASHISLAKTGSSAGGTR